MHSSVSLSSRNLRWQRIARYSLAIYWLAIFTLTHWPRLAPPPIVPQADKVAHFVCYALLAWLYFWARSTVRPLVWNDYFKGVLILAAYGAVDEWLQIPVGRSCELLDGVADVAGILAGTALFWSIARLRQKFGVGGR